MSWEEMLPDVRPCRCGDGTITFHLEMDDWNRARTYTTYECDRCRKEADDNARVQLDRKQMRHALLSMALKLASDRYLSQWLARFEGKSKKAAWQILTAHQKYPSLGTFYQHVRETGLDHYLRWRFAGDFEMALKALKIRDSEIDELIERSKV
jgi:hypothetical protein